MLLFETLVSWFAGDQNEDIALEYVVFDRILDDVENDQLIHSPIELKFEIESILLSKENVEVFLLDFWLKGSYNFSDELFWLLVESCDGGEGTSVDF